MAASLKVSTTFLAIDKFTGILSKMGRGTASFALFAETSAARANRAFRKLTPVFGETGRQLMDAAKTAVLAGGIISGVVFSARSLMNYEKQVASFRTIVSDLTNEEFKSFRLEISKVAKASKGMANAVDVASSFEKIAGLNAKFAETADGLGLVSRATITLSKASGDDLGESAESLVGIMNQFSLGADQANRAINVLAAGQAVGSASISQTAESFVNFGSVAKGANITLEESVGLIQTLGKFSLFGAEAGTKLRGVTLKLQQAGYGYASGQFKIGDALQEVSKKAGKLSTEQQKNALLNKLFGAENVSTGRILLSNINTFKEFTTGVTGTNEAQKAAAINTDTLGEKFKQLQNKWVNLITTNDQATDGLNRLKTAVDFVINNFSTIISVGGGILLFLAAFKALLLTTQGILALYNIALGIQGALTGKASIAIGKNVIAMGAYKAASAIATAAAWLWSVALTAGLWPILAIIAAIAAVVAIFYYWDEIVAWFKDKWKLHTKFISKIWDNVVEAFTKFSFKDFFMNIGKSIISFLLLPLKTVLFLVSKLPGAIGRGAATALDKINEFTATVDVDDSREPAPPLPTPGARSEQLRNEREQTNKSWLGIDINDPGGLIKGTTSKGPLEPSINLTTTQGSR